MAQHFGLSLGRVIQINELSSGEAQLRVLNAQQFNTNAADTLVDAQTGTFAPGTIDVRISVGVTFELTE